MSVRAVPEQAHPWLRILHARGRTSEWIRRANGPRYRYTFTFHALSSAAPSKTGVEEGRENEFQDEPHEHAGNAVASRTSGAVDPIAHHDAAASRKDLVLPSILANTGHLTSQRVGWLNAVLGHSGGLRKRVFVPGRRSHVAAPCSGLALEHSVLSVNHTVLRITHERL